MNIYMLMKLMRCINCNVMGMLLGTVKTKGIIGPYRVHLPLKY